MPPLVTFAQHGQIGIIALNNPPVNALSHGVRKSLCELLAQAFANEAIRAVVIWCEGRTFIAGADIREFGKVPLAPDVPEVVEFIDTAKKPVIAALHGTALGGGLELALACHYRVALASTRLGLPEVTLGLLPGAGGTQRLPRLIGVGAALEMIVGGGLITAPKAHTLGLVDAIVAEPLRENAQAFAERVLLERRPLRRVSELVATLDAPGQLEAYASSIAQKSRGFLAPFHCIEAIKAAVDLPFTEGLARERQLFVELMGSPQSKAQRHAFFAEREVAKAPDLPDDTPTRPLGSIAVLGCGRLARAVARTFADAGLPVTLLADTQAELEDATSGGLGSADPEARSAHVRCTLDASCLSDADLVVEASATDVTAQRSNLARIDAAAKPGAILATTLPYTDIDSIASCTKRSDSVVGLHFHRGGAARVVENVRARDTAPEVSATAMKLVKTLGKIPVLVRGPVGSRMFTEYLREALLLLEEGALPEQVDRVLCEFGFQLGPFAQSDQSGLDIEWHRRKLRFDSLDQRAQACNLLDRICEQGRFGVEAGLGFYRYDADGRPTPDPAIETLLVLHSKERGILRRTIGEREILERCLFAAINEGARLLEEGVAPRPIDIDMIWIHGYAFPVYRGGPMFYADQVGLPNIRQSMLEYAARPGLGHHEPASLLERLASQGQSFYRVV
ncbi:MAG TPA: enoyl-CoA hydratase-related protein [Polyangiaceae bacterium]|nr:enoyl-CoA hydratase-related protein [Polyangiaceae bacterium]